MVRLLDTSGGQPRHGLFLGFFIDTRCPGVSTTSARGLKKAPGRDRRTMMSKTDRRGPLLTIDDLLRLRICSSPSCMQCTLEPLFSAGVGRGLGGSELKG